MTGIDMDISCRVRLLMEFPSEAAASNVARALEPDNEGFVRTRREGKILVADAEAQSIQALLHTLDDYLACLGIAEGLKGGR